MEFNAIKKYFTNCFLLMLPIMAWNIFLTDKLPQAFQPVTFGKDIPSLVIWGENISRVILFALTLFMPLHITTVRQKRGLFIYIVGTILYFTSWLVLIYFPCSTWSNSMLGFMAPAFTPLLWLVGISETSDSFYFGWAYKRWYFISATFIFLSFHIFHTISVYLRIY